MRALLLALLLGASLGFSQRWIYEPWVVPQLATIQHVPMLWWMAVYTPQFFICVAAGLLLRHWKEAAIFSVLGSFFVASVLLYMQMEHRPGHVNGGGLPASVLTFALLCLFLYACVSFLNLLRNWILVRVRRI